MEPGEAHDKRKGRDKENETENDKRKGRDKENETENDTCQ